ncbi:acyl carrier protein [Nocardia sp. NPDC057272]|uniref:acyl carrier protein n=1 Tax=Nocardia sp. NPDC057272 TaxID=3346079 RepID=UPI003637B812
MHASTETTLREIFKIDLEISNDRVHLDSRLEGDLGFDSVSFTIGLVAIEERFGVLLSEEDFFGCETVEHVVAMIDRARIAEKAVDEE